MSENTTRAAVDIGGTFTDFVAVRDGTLSLEKASTTPENYANGVVDVLSKSDVSMDDIEQFVHGTTVVINAITEREGEDCALITTHGFRDVLDITRANRPDMFNFRYEKPEPFVPRRDRFEVSERIDQAGDILTELDPSDVREAAAEIRDRGIETIAVAYVNAYANPDHEQRTRDLIADEYPEAYVTLSHELSEEYREYERTNTAVLNSYVRPIADDYLTTLADHLEESGVEGNRYVMKSNAGTSSFSQARQSPIEMVESGPVGGVFGAARIGEQLGEPDVISFDMGGTTAKTSLIEDGDVDIETEYWLESSARDEGYPVQVPVVDIVEIGAGGGSIAWIDQGGSINVGPKSAGADPGPACYGRGGTEPTVTDANLLTGRLNPEYFLGGEMELDVDQARASLEPIADEFGTDVRQAAHGVLQVVNSNMAHALKQVSLQRGYDPRQFALVASGGAGGLHAATLGRELSVKETIVPRAPGQFSAWGMLLTDLRRDYVRTLVRSFEPDAADIVDDAFASMADRAREAFDAEGVPREDIELEYSVDLRYDGQEHTVQTPVRSDGDRITGTAIERTIETFHLRHDQAYNFQLDDPVELVNLRLTATAAVSKPAIDVLERDGRLSEARKAERPVDFGTEGTHETPIYDRSTLPVEVSFDGPAVVEEPACTTLVHPDQTCRVDEYGNLRISQQ
ncbi:hydantoinase/oxoprolinase family protein [Halobiforma nitratireducens]|uniref:N-methylhydantoinase A (ATP-hydrolyzing) n=1 Tax=Halobiforma nitratireducens JCM 10879 TaxID=1227454 RepID=M0MNB9_9EURY|nr:hydantoinase/oxoprolinase family protein [Halobiforma nitratireducens]EMA47187.1 N-methylhydantoinase A (ATP-hydrolyzing) [Halobiforma nitratireducens JCM 10879]